MARRKVNL